MISFQLFTETVSGYRSRYCYRLARQSLVSEIPISRLSDFQISCPEIPNQNDKIIKFKSPTPGKVIYQGSSWIADRWREVACSSLENGYEISVEEIGNFWIAADGTRINYSKGIEEPSIEFVIDAALGPVLILALALHETWCLHASVVSSFGQQIAFVGESGKGKSTLARWLGDLSGENWSRQGDDILPLSQISGSIRFLPHFPQPKIKSNKQPSFGLPEQLPLRAIYVLRRPEDEDSISIRRLGTQEGALALIRHTVAARLFDADLMARHLDFCIQASAQIGVKQLVYPLEEEALPLVKEALLADLNLPVKESGIKL